ncbi:MAG: HAMP domain-containing methyl-accepting chemotaxis protein [Longimicrobiales bacterium]
MNWLRTYFARIQGRLSLAFGIGALGMIAIWGVSTIKLERYSARVADQLNSLQQRLSAGASLHAAVVDQMLALREFELAGNPASLLLADSLAGVARQQQKLYNDLIADSTIVTVMEEDAVVAERQGLLDILQGQTDVQRTLDQAKARLQQQDAPGAQQLISQAGASLQSVRALIRKLNLDELRNVQQSAIVSQQQLANLGKKLTVILIITLLIMLAFAIFTLRAIERPLKRLVAAANQLGTGDLNVSIDGNMPEEFHVLANAFIGMAGRFRTIVSETVDTANKIGASATDLSAISEEVAASSGEVSTAMVGITQGAEEQALGLRTVTDALDVMRSRALDIDSASEQVQRLSQQIGEVAESKRAEVARALSMLLEVRDLVRTSGNEVNDLQQASESITSFVETIQGIARQTNLLALNAAIEAARAGDQGRGFAVVADEVRKLADGSARAADEVATAVKRISFQIEAVVATIERGFAKVAGVEEASKNAEAAFEDIVAAVSSVRDAAARVAVAASQNREAVGTVDGAVREVGATAESHAASAEQVSAAAEEQSAATEEMSAASIELLGSADRLKDLVAGFRT